MSIKMMSFFTNPPLQTEQFDDLTSISGTLLLWVFQYTFQSQRQGLMTWMTEMDVFLHAEDPTKGDLPTLQAQLKESSEVQNDIQTLQKNMDNINHLYRGFSVNIDPVYGEKLATEVEGLNTNWNKVLILAEQQHERLQGSLDSSEEIYREIRKVIAWLEPLKEEISNKDYAVDSINDLQVKNKKFKVSKLLIH